MEETIHTEELVYYRGGQLIMPEYPLLIFPEPSLSERERRSSGGKRLRLPDSAQQARRLEMQFPILQRTMERQMLALQDNPLGLQPELALVLETIGPIESFVNAVRRIEGLEWLGEVELDDVAPQYGFEDEDHPQKLLRGRLFLIMSNQRALEELQSLFSRWQQNPDMKFPYGLGRWKHAFAHLYAIRPWNAQDRIRETGVLEDWQFRVEHDQVAVPFEAELWFRASSDRRRQAEAHLQSIVESLGGEVIQQCVISEIAYHGVLGRIPINQVSQILAEDDIRLFQCEDIMHLRPVGQCAIRIPDESNDTAFLSEDRQSNLPEGEPIVALFDGLPLAGHRLLNGRLIVDDPDGFEDGYQARERVHGTGMASLICHGDLSGAGDSASRPVYVRPIMQPRRGFDGQFVEAIPEEMLPIDLIHRAVRRLYEYEGTEPPAAPDVRVVNLSVCDCSRPFDRGISPWARLLDWLSWEYNVLFIVSAGNHLHEIELSVPRSDLATLTAEDREKAVVKAIADDTRNRRLLSPAETLNGLTVAATHENAGSLTLPSTLVDPYVHMGLTSPISAQGPGYRRAIKPDILLPGGRQLLSEKLGSTHHHATFQVTSSGHPPGQCVATPGASGELDRTWYTRGTSNAAALASHWAMFLFDTIERLREEAGAGLSTDYDVVLLKTLLVHGAEWGEPGALYESFLRTPEKSRAFKDYVGRFLGYGAADVSKVLTCTDQRVTVLGAGELVDDESQEYRFPLPPCLSAVTHRRRLTITLAWLTPVNSTNQKYRVAQLWFNPRNELAPERVCADYQAVQRGSVQHEVLVGERAMDFQDGRAIAIKVNCRADGGDIPKPIRYGLAVTLEVAENVSIPIYQEVRDRLRIRVPVQG